MNDLSQTFHSMPDTSLIAVSALVIVGLLLWAAGKKLLRFGFAILGIIVGGAIGWIIGESLHLGIWTWATTIVGAVVLACIMAIAYRLAIAGAMAMIFAVASPMGVISFAEWQARSEGKTLQDIEAPNSTLIKPETQEKIDEAAKSAATAVNEQLDRAKTALSESLGGKADEQIAELSAFTARIRDAVRQKWDSTPEALRPTLTVSMIAGAVFGLILGGVAPTLSAVAITALGGSLLWLCGLQIIAVRYGIAERIWIPTTGTSWLTLWLITSFVGVVIQWTFRKRAADKPSTQG